MQDYLMTLLGGLAITLQLTAFSLLLGVLMAAGMTWVLERRIPVVTQLVQLWVLVFTGTPLLIQIFLIYYGPGQFEWLKAGPLWPLLKQPWFCAVLALGFNTAAYSTRLFKGALDAIPAGEVEACRATVGGDGAGSWQESHLLSHRAAAGVASRPAGARQPVAGITERYRAGVADRGQRDDASGADGLGQYL